MARTRRRRLCLPTRVWRAANARPRRGRSTAAQFIHGASQGACLQGSRGSRLPEESSRGGAASWFEVCESGRSWGWSLLNWLPSHPRTSPNLFELVHETDVTTCLTEGQRMLERASLNFLSAAECADSFTNSQCCCGWKRAAWVRCTWRIL